MPLTVNFSKDKKEMTMKIDGRFDFNLQAAFRNSYRDVPQDTRFIIDLSDTSFMDSSAMGMLLLLREHSGEHEPNIRLLHCNPEVRRILEISNLDKMFAIE